MCAARHACLDSRQRDASLLLREGPRCLLDRGCCLHNDEYIFHNLTVYSRRVCSSIVGIAWPGYMSFRSLETFDPNDEKQWLTYWVIFACLETVEVFGYWFLLWCAPVATVDLRAPLHTARSCSGALSRALIVRLIRKRTSKRSQRLL